MVIMEDISEIIHPATFGINENYIPVYRPFGRSMFVRRTLYVDIRNYYETLSISLRRIR